MIIFDRKINLSKLFTGNISMTKVSLDNSLLGELSTWTKVPLTIVSLDNCCNTLDFRPLEAFVLVEIEFVCGVGWWGVNNNNRVKPNHKLRLG